MRDQFEFLGIRAPQRRALLREFLADRRDDVTRRLPSIAEGLWDLPFREFQYAAVDLLERFDRHLTDEDLPLLQRLITTKSWWDTVDGLAANVVGRLLLRYPERRDPTIDAWRHSQDLWLRRTTLLFQLKYREATDPALLLSIIRDNLDSSEFFIQKAIGWALREYSKTDADAVVRFVRSAALPSLSEREALKWLRAQSR